MRLPCLSSQGCFNKIFLPDCAVIPADTRMWASGISYGKNEPPHSRG